MTHTVVVISKAQVYRHLELVADSLSVVESRGVLEVEVVVSGRIVVEVVTDQEDLFDCWMQAVAEVARRSKARGCHQNTFVIFDAVLAPLHIEVVDDMSIGDEGE